MAYQRRIRPAEVLRVRHETLPPSEVASAVAGRAWGFGGHGQAVFRNASRSAPCGSCFTAGPAAKPAGPGAEVESCGASSAATRRAGRRSGTDLKALTLLRTLRACGLRSSCSGQGNLEITIPFANSMLQWQPNGMGLDEVTAREESCRSRQGAFAIWTCCIAPSNSAHTPPRPCRAPLALAATSPSTQSTPRSQDVYPRSCDWPVSEQRGSLKAEENVATACVESLRSISHNRRTLRSTGEDPDRWLSG